MGQPSFVDDTTVPGGGEPLRPADPSAAQLIYNLRELGVEQKTKVDDAERALKEICARIADYKHVCDVLRDKERALRARFDEFDTRRHKTK